MAHQQCIDYLLCESSRFASELRLNSHDELRRELREIDIRCWHLFRERSGTVVDIVRWVTDEMRQKVRDRQEPSKLSLPSSSLLPVFSPHDFTHKHPGRWNDGVKPAFWYIVHELPRGRRPPAHNLWNSILEWRKNHPVTIARSVPESRREQAEVEVFIKTEDVVLEAEAKLKEAEEKLAIAQSLEEMVKQKTHKLMLREDKVESRKAVIEDKARQLAELDKELDDREKGVKEREAELQEGMLELRLFREAAMGLKRKFDDFEESVPLRIVRPRQT